MEKHPKTLSRNLFLTLLVPFYILRRIDISSAACIVHIAKDKLYKI